MVNSNNVLDGTVLPVKIAAQMVRAGIASAVGGADVVGYYSCVLPEEREGRISVTVIGGSGRKRTLTYLMGSRTYDDVSALHLGPDHDVHVVYDLVGAQDIAEHVRAWMAAA